MTAVLRLTPADARAYCALRREMLTNTPWAFWSSPEDDRAATPEAVARTLGEPEHAILAVPAPVAAGDARPAAFLACAGVVRATRRKARHRATIWGVYTTPAARGRGLGASVMAEAVRTARSWPGVELIALSASVRAEAAIRLYESLGFERWGREPDCMRVDGASYDEIHMLKRL